MLSCLGRNEEYPQYRRNGASKSKLESPVHERRQRSKMIGQQVHEEVQQAHKQYMKQPAAKT